MTALPSLKCAEVQFMPRAIHTKNELMLTHRELKAYAFMNCFAMQNMNSRFRSMN